MLQMRQSIDAKEMWYLSKANSLYVVLPQPLPYLKLCASRCNL